MSRSSFVSFHYQNDYWRVQQILRMGAITGQEILPAQNWEAVKKKGDTAVHQWIDKEMKPKGCCRGLIGSGRRKSQVRQVRNPGGVGHAQAVLGSMHGLLDSRRRWRASTAGTDPFSLFGFPDSTKTFADFVPVPRPGGTASRSMRASRRTSTAGSRRATRRP